MSVIDRAKRFLWRRQQNYVATFDSPTGKKVLADLAVFCRAGESTFHDNERVQSKLDGRREVFLRISHMLHLDEATIWKLYDGRPDNAA